MDEIIVFRQLLKSEVKQIAEILLRDLLARLMERDITLTVSEGFKDHLVNVGFDPKYGARPLRRALMNLLEDALAEALLA